MSLIFSWQDIINRPRGLTFDDVLILPARSDVRSRREPSLATRVTRKLTLQTPAVSANMDTITEESMAGAMHALGGLGILHRFLSVDAQAAQVRRLAAAGVDPVAASVGVGDEARVRARALVEAGAKVITVDIAHGHCVQMTEMLKWLKDTFAGVEVIAGNVAMPDGALDLVEVGADAVKVGIGPGSMCTTRIITGCGVPQLTAIALCAQVTAEKGVPLIADGGLRTSGDVVKALAAGADCVMLGSMLSGTIETPGDIKGGKKQYRGMASKDAQVSWRGGIPEGMAAEGVATTVPVKGHVRDVILEVCGGIRSGMSYINAQTLAEIREKARFMEVTAAGVLESRAHGLG